VLGCVLLVEVGFFLRALGRTVPLAADFVINQVESGKIRPGALVRVEVAEHQESLALTPEHLD